MANRNGNGRGGAQSARGRRRAQPTSSGSGRSEAARGDELDFHEWVRAQAPHLRRLSGSEPSPSLQRHNLVVVLEDPEIARSVALTLERSKVENASIGTLVLGHPESPEDVEEIDSQGVTTHAAKRAVIGGLPGAVIAAAVIGLGVFLITGSWAGALGGALGGAIFGWYTMAVWSFVVGTGQSPAYRQSFVDPDATDLVIVSVHADDKACVDEAERSIADVDGIRLHRVDGDGNVAAR
jgi:hypothetical protein